MMGTKGYYKTAKWQNTTAPWATNEYVMTKLNWGRPRVVRTKKILEDNGFIVMDKLDGDDYTPVHSRTQRLLFVVRKDK